MIYSIPLRTRGTECGPDRWVTLPAVVGYMEYCRWQWMREPSLGLVDAVEEGHGFYVVNQSIAMSRRFGQGVQARVRCALRHAGRSVARGEQDVVRDDGVLLATCRIRGVWMSPSGRFARLPDAVKESVSDVPLASQRGEPDAGHPRSLFHPPQPLRSGLLDLELPADHPNKEHHRQMRVRATDCDIFGHVNAANYARFVADSLALQGASASLHRAELAYTGQARAGDEVVVHTAALGEDRWAARILRADKVLFSAVVQTEASRP